MNICNEPKFSFSSKDKTIKCTIRNGLESYNLLNTCSGIFYETEYIPIRLKEHFEKEIKLEGKYLNNAKNYARIYYKYNKQILIR